MHRHLPAKLSQPLRIGSRLHGDQHADLAEARGDAVVHVAGNRPFAHRKLSRAAQVHVLADGRDGVGDRGRDGLTRCEFGTGQSLHRDGLIDSQSGDAGDQLLELLVARDEIGFGVNLDGGGAGAVGRDADQALCRDAAGLFGGGGQALGAQPIDRGFDIAVGFLQRLLAIHHASAGLLAKRFHIRCCECHNDCSP